EDRAITATVRPAVRTPAAAKKSKLPPAATPTTPRPGRAKEKRPTS
ncbi:MAG: transcriptional regulator, partial [Kofleriaceae bacterium]|nr:transcriptional regulator [Kofleriaceae bacterium]